MPLRSLWFALVLLSILVACSEAPLSTSTSTSSSSSGAGGGGGEAVVPAADPTGFRAGPLLLPGRTHHTATLLRDGRVLVIGGEDPSGDPIPNVDVFDPVTETFTSLAPLAEPREFHTATLLSDGRVLVTGGGLNSQIGIPSGEGVLKSAAVFDPATSTFSPVGDMADPRAFHEASLLADGRVLVVGGATNMMGGTCTVVPNCYTGKALATAEVFDPATSIFNKVGDMSAARLGFALPQLADGRPFAIGGANDTVSLASTELFDPTTNQFVAGATLAGDRIYLGAARLGSGHVLVAGGKKANVSPLVTSEVFDPVVNAWSKTQNLDRPRTAAAMITLQSGHVLTVGGYDQTQNGAIKNTSIYDETSGTWSRIGDLGKARFNMTATLLSDGRVLVVGGSSSPSTEILQ